MWRRYENIVAAYQTGNSSKIMRYPICLPLTWLKTTLLRFRTALRQTPSMNCQTRITLNNHVWSCKSCTQWRASNIPYASASNTITDPSIRWLRPIIIRPFSFLITNPNAKCESPSLTKALTLSFRRNPVAYTPHHRVRLLSRHLRTSIYLLLFFNQPVTHFHNKIHF